MFRGGIWWRRAFDPVYWPPKPPVHRTRRRHPGIPASRLPSVKVVYPDLGPRPPGIQRYSGREECCRLEERCNTYVINSERQRFIIRLWRPGRLGEFNFNNKHKQILILFLSFGNLPLQFNVCRWMLIALGVCCLLGSSTGSYCSLERMKKYAMEACEHLFMQDEAARRDRRSIEYPHHHMNRLGCKYLSPNKKKY